MLRIFKVNNKVKSEVFPSNGIYNVYESSKYEILLEESNINTNFVFLEDVLIDSRLIKISDSKLLLIENYYFQNYFGLASLNINNIIYSFNIKIEKLKLDEIESIFTFLWNKEKNIFNIFLSKSTNKLEFKYNGLEISQTSKFINFINDYFQVFKKMYVYFKNNPHTHIEKSKKILDYNNSKLTYESVNWLMNNLDLVDVGLSLKNDINSFKLNGTYGIINKIENEVNINSLITYENSIIIGGFVIILRKIKEFKKEIKSNVNIGNRKNERFADFKDLKIIPYIKMYDDITIVEKKIKTLYTKYRNIFKNIEPKIENIKLTPVFAKKIHYQKAYSYIKQLYTLKFELYGSHNLLNITKLSTLYEVYNLYQIIEILSNKLNLDNFKVETSSSREDNIINKFEYLSGEYVVKIYYENKYGKNIKSDVDLIRIDTSISTYYNPDFIIEFICKGLKSYIILDAKYSKYEIVKNKYLNHCVYKYILNTGLNNDKYKKIDSLVLLYPMGKSDKYIDSAFYKPTIGLVQSKPNCEIDLKDFIENIIADKFPKMLYK